MNLFLRPIDDVTGVTWSIIWCMIILLTGVAYYIYTVMRLAFQELEEDGSNDTAEQEELLQLPSSRDQ
jgi:hypothetical protein